MSIDALLSKELVNKIFDLKFKKNNLIDLFEYENNYAFLIIDEIKNTIPNVNSDNFKDPQRIL